MTTQTSPVTGVTTYGYDPAGNLLSSTDARGAVTTRTYDAANRLTHAASTLPNRRTENVWFRYDDSTDSRRRGATLGQPDESYRRGRLSAMIDPSGTTFYSYDRRGLLRAETRTIESATYVTRYGHDQNGSRTTLTYPSGDVIEYTFDHADRPLGASFGATTLVDSAEYEPFGPMKRLSFGNGTEQVTDYDARYRVTRNELLDGVVRLAGYDYEHDAAANVTAIDDLVDATYDRTFGYDDLSRLTVANSGSSLWGSPSGPTYTYDAMGNVLALELGTSRTATFSYSGRTPKLTGVTESSVLRSVTYDAAGNETAIGSVTSTYSPRNHLESSGGISYVYDGRGVRTIARTAPPAGTLSSLTISPASVEGGNPSVGTVTLTGPTPPGGVVVSLTSLDPTKASVPSTVTVAGGRRGDSAGFVITTFAVTSPDSVTIEASGGGECDLRVR